ncbi:MAG: DsbA family protein [Pirellulaceae bacterium]
MADSTPSAARKVIGLGCLCLSLFASLALVLQQLGGLALPGCGPESACAQLADSRWGSVMGWPVSYAGLAWFTALAAAWIAAGREGFGWILRGVVLLGVACSLFFFAVMAIEQHFCLYCVLVHLGNFAFAAVALTGPVALHSLPRAALGLAATGILVSLALGGARYAVESKVDQQAHQQLDQSLQEVVDRQATDSGDPPFTGRYRLGPELAAIRLVIFSDYQCGDCQEIEQQVQAACQGHDDISVSAKHFPLCRDCNRIIRDPRFHDNACRAARAAEAAGILAGNEGFWRMHHWLFEQKGKFTDESLADSLPELGFSDTEEFLEVMNGTETLRRVQQDVDEATTLGIDETPMIFLNGVELRGWNAEEALTKAVARLREENLSPGTAAGDQPVPALERLVEVWRGEEVVEIPSDAARWTLGPADAPHRLTLVVDYASPYTPRLSRLARGLVEDRHDVRLELLQFPISPSLNSAFAKMKQEFYGPSTEMARLVELAGSQRDADAFWQMHRWVLQHQGEYSRQAAREQAKQLGLDEEPIEAAFDEGPSPVDERIKADIAAALAFDSGWSPDLYLDGRRISRWNPTAELLEALLAEESPSP